MNKPNMKSLPELLLEEPLLAENEEADVSERLQVARFLWWDK
jgi:hypothetical protein